MLEQKVKERGICPLCDDSGEVVVRPTRLMGATYWGRDSGDEYIEPCPLCVNEEA